MLLEQLTSRGRRVRLIRSGCPTLFIALAAPKPITLMPLRRPPVSAPDGATRLTVRIHLRRSSRNGMGRLALVALATVVAEWSAKGAVHVPR